MAKRISLMLAASSLLCLLWPLQWACGAPAAQRAMSPPEFSFSQFYFESVGDTEAIPFGVVTAQVIDARGMLWMGTQNGLISYDGYRFNKYTHVVDDPGSLSGDFVNCLWADRDGRIWIGTNGAGLSVFDPTTNRFETFHHDSALAGSLGDDTVTAIAGDAVGGHWIATDQGLEYRSAASKNFFHYRHDAADTGSLASDQVRSLLLDRQGRLWVGSASGLQRLAPGATAFENVASRQDSAASLYGRNVQAIFEAADGKLWLGTATHGVAWLGKEDRALHWLDTDSAMNGNNRQAGIKAFAQPQADSIWIGSFGSGITVASADGVVVRRLHHDPSIAGSLALDTLGALTLDSSGQLWIGTWGGGLQRTVFSNSAFRLLRHSAQQSNSLSTSDVHSMLPLDAHRILIGSSGHGIDILDRTSGVVGGYRPHRGGLPEDMILAVTKAPDGTLWVGTLQSGIFHQQAGSDHWQAYSVARLRSNPAVNALFVDRRGEVFAGTADGLWHWHAGQKYFEAFPDTDSKAMRAPVYSIAEDGAGRLWAGSLRGLWVLEAGAQTLRGIHPDPNRPDSLGTELIGEFLLDHTGRFWVATVAGLERLLSWDGQRARFEHISALAGHKGENFGTNLLEDKDGRIWSEDHLFDPKRMRIEHLTKADGLDIGTPWIGSYARTDDGLFLYGGTKGLAIVDAQKFHRWEDRPPLIATELKIDGVVQPLGRLAPALMLSPEQRNFSIEFAALDYSAPQKNLYAYKLQGYDQNWINVDAAHRSASYGNLWPGRYTLEVRGSNRIGDWSPHMLTVPVQILPAFWQTGWFLAFALMVTAVAVYGSHRWRSAVLHAKAEELQALVDVRTRELLGKNQELARLAITDRLTRLYNRLMLDERLEEQIARAQRYCTSFALVLIDLDKFKSVNDTYGHQVGDQVLISVANILSQNTRNLDAVGRWGGEEFLIIASETDLASAIELAEKLRKKLEMHQFPIVGNCTASFGVTAYRAGDSITGMITRVDRALYAAKENGRNRVESND